jgi:hypothetical protein
MENVAYYNPLHDLHWFLISIRPLWSYNYNIKEFSPHHYQNRTIKHVTNLEIDTEVVYMNNLRYHTVTDEVTADALYKCSYYWWIISLDNLH